MNNVDILKHLVRIVKRPNRCVLTADLLSQEELIEVQQELANLMGQIANENGFAAWLHKQIPHVFEL